MKAELILTWGYAVFLLVGGLMGYLMAGSLMSLGVSTVLALLLFWSGYELSQDNPVAYRATIGLLIAILAFFSYRFFLTFKMFPPGVMALVTLAVLGLLIYLKEKQLHR